MACGDGRDGGEGWRRLFCVCFISLVTDIISLISDVIFPVVNVIPSASDVIFLVVNFISSASDVISPVMPLKMISGLETVISRLDIIVADTEITISCLAIVLKGLSTNLRMVGVGTNKTLSRWGWHRVPC